MTKPAKRIGRPLKPTVGHERVALGLKVTAEMKRIIDQRAQKTGRTQSQEAEAMLESALQFERMLELMRATMADMENQNVEAALFRLGFTPLREVIGDKVWKTWLEPGHPRAQRSGFAA